MVGRAATKRLTPRRHDQPRSGAAFSPVELCSLAGEPTLVKAHPLHAYVGIAARLERRNREYLLWF